MLTDELARYLRETLSVTVTLSEWPGQEMLPLFLRDLYVYQRVDLGGLTTFLLMIDERGDGLAPSAVGKHVTRVRKEWGGEVAYVRKQVNAYWRKRLIQAGVQFVIPGNQMFLPALAIDLRERFRRGQPGVQKFSPATQALVLYWIYNGGGPASGRSTSTEMARLLGYTRMTMSRAFREVDAVLDELGCNENAAEPKNGRFTSRELWEMLLPYLSSPVSRRIVVQKADFWSGQSMRAGLTALADYSMLAEPGYEIQAMGRDEWKALGAKRGLQLPDRPDVDTVEIEVWNYSPELFAKDGRQGAVDPLSLYLSLRNFPDERVQKALEELLGGVSW